MVLELVAFYFFVAVVPVVKAALEALVVIEHLPIGVRVGDAGFTHAFRACAVHHAIDDADPAQLSGYLPLETLGFYPCLAVDQGVLRDDVGHRVDRVQRLLGIVEGGVRRQMPTVGMKLVFRIIRGCRAILTGDSAIRVKARALLDVAGIHILSIKGVSYILRTLVAVVVTNLIETLIQHLIAVVRIDVIAGFGGKGSLIADQQAPDHQAEGGNRQKFHDGIPFQATP